MPDTDSAEFQAARQKLKEECQDLWQQLTEVPVAGRELCRSQSKTGSNQCMCKRRQPLPGFFTYYLIQCNTNIGGKDTAKLYLLHKAHNNICLLKVSTMKHI